MVISYKGEGERFFKLFYCPLLSMLRPILLRSGGHPFFSRRAKPVIQRAEKAQDIKDESGAQLSRNNIDLDSSGRQSGRLCKNRGLASLTLMFQFDKRLKWNDRPDGYSTSKLELRGGVSVRDASWL